MSENNPGRGNNNGNGSGSTFKRPRLLSFQGPTSESIALNHPPMAAGPSSSSLEEINVRQPSVDMRPGMAPDLASWQEAQIAACIEDNTINMVLEQYLNFYETRHYGVDVAQAAASIPDPNDDESEMQQQQGQEVDLLEDRAIMAAISERGLQPVLQSNDNYDDDDGDGMGGAVGGAVVTRRMDLDHHQQQGMDLLETAVAVAIQEKGLTAGGGAQHGLMDEDDGS
uniref:Uncharacterized protein n=1 Tax=Aedes albopictus TaxID=7160 RepID=A0A023EK77_AEDAL